MTDISPSGRRLTPVWVQIGHDQPFRTTLERFEVANDLDYPNDHQDPEAVAAVAAVRAGMRYTGGGGAGSVWTIAPGDRLVDALSAPFAPR